MEFRTDYNAEFRILHESDDALAARIKLIESSSQTLLIQTFIFKDDSIGKLILTKIYEAANRGVKVKFLIDDMWSKGVDSFLINYAAHENISVKFFNPLSRSLLRYLQLIFRIGTITRRMHNKVMVADEKYAITGGRNIAVEYFDMNPDVNFTDLDVMVKGDVISSFVKAFDKYWTSSLAVSIKNLTESHRTISPVKKFITQNEIDSNISTDNNKIFNDLYDNASKQDTLIFENEFHPVTAKLIYDLPNKITKVRSDVDLHLSAQLSKFFEAAKNEIIIVSPYFLPGKKGIQGFAEKVKQGVKVKVVTNSLNSNNHTLVHAHYAKYRKRLINSGIELFELRSKRPNKSLYTTSLDNKHGKKAQKPNADKTINKNQTLHAKTFLFDQKHIFIGSLNMDPRSWVENTEIGLVLDHCQTGEQMSQWFKHGLIEKAYSLKLDENDKLVWIDSMGKKTHKEPGLNLYKRLKLLVLSKLPVESLL